MPTDAIVIAFNVTKDFRPRLFDRFKAAAFDKFRLKTRKEALGLRVIASSFPCCSYFAESREYKAVVETRPKHIDCRDSLVNNRTFFE